MSRSIIVRRHLVLLFLLLLQVLTNCTLAIPLTTLFPFFNNITISRAPTPNKGFISENVTSLGTPSNPLDYLIVGTPLILRITETGDLFTQIAVNDIMDGAIRRVVKIINKGSGSKFLEHSKFGAITESIELRIQSLPDKGFTYFVLGKQPHHQQRDALDQLLLFQGHRQT